MTSSGQHRTTPLLLVIAILTGCRSTYTTIVQDRDTVVQLAPFLYVLSGNYDGVRSVSEFKALGNLGIGTFDGLDGEAVLLDGIVHQVKGDGTVCQPPDTCKLPFGTCTLFDDDLQRRMRGVDSFARFSAVLEDSLDDKRIFYAILAHGRFKTLRVRSCDKQLKPYKPLAEATKAQHVYDYTDTAGTLVGFWTPPFVPGSIGVPGFHLHFLSDDHARGGHVLDFSADEITLSLDPTPRITIDFSSPADLPLVERDIEQQVHDAERLRK